MIPINELARGYRLYKEEYDRKAIEVLESGWYVLGKEVDAFEKEYFNLALVLPHDPIRRDTQETAVTIRFIMPEGEMDERHRTALWINAEEKEEVLEPGPWGP